MAAVMFDTAKRVDDLEAVKIPREQARAIVDLVRTAQEAAAADQAKAAQEASAHAVAELDSKTEKALIKLEAKVDKLEAKVVSVEVGLRQEIAIASKDLLIKLGSGLIVGVGIILAAMRWMPHA